MKDESNFSTYIANKQTMKEACALVIQQHYHKGPARQTCYANGNIRTQEWVRYGVVHCDDGPAYQEFWENGFLRVQIWKNEGRIHRLGGPAYVIFFMPSKIEVFLKYLIDKVSFKRTSGKCISYPYGKIHMEEWYENGQSHRIDAPAINVYNQQGSTIIREYWIEGQKLTEDQFNRHLNILQIKKLISQDTEVMI